MRDRRIRTLSRIGYRSELTGGRTGQRGMKIGAPTLLLSLIAVALAGLAVTVRLRPELFDRALVDDGFWVLAGAFVVLVLAVLKKGEDA